MALADYAHWNEDAEFMWWNEEGKFANDPEWDDESWRDEPEPEPDYDPEWDEERDG